MDEAQREKIREYHRRWTRSHPERTREYNRRHRSKLSPEEIADGIRKATDWKRAHPLQTRIAQRRFYYNNVQPQKGTIYCCGICGVPGHNRRSCDIQSSIDREGISEDWLHD